MIDQRFIYLALSLNLLGGLVYLIATLRGKVKPNKVTWFLWALAPLIAFIAEVKQGVGLPSLTTFIVGFNPLLIFIASFFNKKASWKLTNFDLGCGAISLIGLALWGITRVGDLAILFSILADGLAALPTILKLVKAPETENYNIFLLGAISAFITLLTIKEWTFPNFGFPLYLLLICTLIVCLGLFRLGKITK